MQEGFTSSEMCFFYSGESSVSEMTCDLCGDADLASMASLVYLSLFLLNRVVFH